MTVDLETRVVVDGDEGSPWRTADPRIRRRRRWMLAGVIGVFTTSMVVAGVPTGREWLTGWMLLALLAACGGQLSVWRRAVVRDWLPLLAVLFAYDLLRGMANEIGGSLFGLSRWRSNPDNFVSFARAHLDAPLEADRWMFGGHVPTTWLQERYFDLGVAHWYDRVAVVVYLSHFIVSLTLAIVLWCVSYRVFRHYLAAFVTLTLITLSTYILYPAAPPWMAGLNHHLPETHRVVRETLSTLGSQTVNTAVEKGAAYSNPVAAMPSLHAAIPAFLMFFFWVTARWWLRVILVAYTLAMAVTLVYTGEHYVIDALVGWLYAGVSVLAVRRFVLLRAREPQLVEAPEASRTS